MVVVSAETKISKGSQTVVPAAIRKIFGVGEDDKVVWIVEDDKVMIEFRKKGKKLADLVGKIDMGKTDAAAELDDVIA